MHLAFGVVSLSLHFNDDCDAADVAADCIKLRDGDGSAAAAIVVLMALLTREARGGILLFMEFNVFKDFCVVVVVLAVVVVLIIVGISDVVLVVVINVVVFVIFGIEVVVTNGILVVVLAVVVLATVVVVTVVVGVVVVLVVFCSFNNGKFVIVDDLLLVNKIGFNVVENSIKSS